MAAAVIFGVWWDHGGQAWVALHTGTDYCVNLPSPDVTVCKAYGFWSGFGSDIGEITVIAALIGLWRKFTCHYTWWCWRHPHFQVGATPYMVCARHHPEEQPSVKEAVAAEEQAIAVAKERLSEIPSTADEPQRDPPA